MARDVSEIVESESTLVSGIEEREEVEEEGFEDERGGGCSRKVLATRRKMKGEHSSFHTWFERGNKQKKGLTKYLWCRRDLFSAVSSIKRTKMAETTMAFGMKADED